MNILVTGGAGFIGSHLCERLTNMGHHLTVIDNLSNGRKSFLATLPPSKIQFIEGSVMDRPLLQKTLKDCDLVFHLAATLGVKNTVEDPLKIIHGNIDGTRNVLELAYEKNVKVVFASTSEVYGKNPNLPFTEDSDRILGSAQTSRWCYATAKSLDEHMCFAYGKKGLPISIVRYFNAYGPRQTSSQYGGVIPKFIVAALKNEPITVFGDGNQTRCFTFISDMIDGTVACMYPKANNEVFNIGTTEQITINSLAQMIKDITNSNSDIIHIPYERAYGLGYEDTPDRLPDISKAASTLGFNPKVSLENGLKQTISYYQTVLEISDSE
jgi:UDP-glucose 4-epimerase